MMLFSILHYVTASQMKEPPTFFFSNKDVGDEVSVLQISFSSCMSSFTNQYVVEFALYHIPIYVLRCPAVSQANIFTIHDSDEVQSIDHCCRDHNRISNNITSH